MSDAGGVPQRPSDDRERDRQLLLVMGVVAAAVVLYGLLIQGSILAIAYLLVPFTALYLFWRLVRAVERIAAAREREADYRTGGEQGRGRPGERSSGGDARDRTGNDRE